MPTPSPRAPSRFVAPLLAFLAGLATPACARPPTTSLVASASTPSSPETETEACTADAAIPFPRAGGIVRVERLTRSRLVGRSEIRQTSGVAIHLNGDGRTSADDIRRAVACQSATPPRAAAADDAANPLLVRGAQSRVIEEGPGFVVEVRGQTGPSAREIYSRASKLQPL